MRALVVAILCVASAAHADDKRPIVGFQVKGDSKVTDTTT